MIEPLRRARDVLYRLCAALLYPINRLLAEVLRVEPVPDSVLHISYMVHIPYDTVRILREQGINADYLAIGSSPVWNRCDYQFRPSRLPLLRVLQETVMFWRVVAKYQTVHLHFMLTLTTGGWELPLLKRMGRKIVVHYRGCEIRNRERNMMLHSDLNICENCDYNATVCRHRHNRLRRKNSRRYGDAFLATTPDLLDFAPDAVHMPFFSPPDVEVAEQQRVAGVERSKPSACHAPGVRSAPPRPPHTESPRDASRPFRIVHVTNHPGIEGTADIEAAINRLIERGYEIEFVFLKGVPHERVLAEYRTADLAIGKMKMGYYANAQIESMSLGVPTITWVRPEFLTPELEQSGLILTHPNRLEQTIEHYLTHPEQLAAKARIARKSILSLHDNRQLAERYRHLYRSLHAGKDSQRAVQEEIRSRPSETPERLAG